MENFHDSFEKLKMMLAALEALLPSPTPDQTMSDSKKPKMTSGVSSKDVTPAPPDLLPVGKLLDVTFTNPTHPEASQVVTLLVQMIPYIIAAQAAPMLLTATSSQSFSQRYAQWKAGEISFWRDLIFQVDQIKKTEEGVRSDKSGAFADYLKDVSKRDGGRLLNIFANASERKISSNYANSVMILSEDTVKAAKADGFDFDKEDTRNRFFLNSYAMMVFVVDDNFQTVALYMNGIEDVGHYGFDHFTSAKKGGDIDLVQLLSALSQGRSPRF
jgi:hypothetical protein